MADKSFKFSFSLDGYLFNEELGSIRLAATVANDALTAQLNERKTELNNYRLKGEFIGERDEGGGLLWEKDQILELEIRTIMDAIPQMRRAFVLCAYHFWETTMLRYLSRKLPDLNDKDVRGFDNIIKNINKISDSCWEIENSSYEEMKFVSYMSNIIKHNSTKGREKIQDHIPKILKEKSFSDPNHFDMDHLHTIFDIVCASGPIVSKDFN